MNTQRRLDLEQLQHAIEQRDQQQIQFLLKRLLQHIDYYVALAVPMEQLRIFLPQFERAYPEETWVRKLLLMISSYGKVPDNDVAAYALQQDFPVAGAGNFLKGVYDLTQAMSDKHTPEARVGFMASAVVNAIMAQLVHEWYHPRPKAWQIIRQQAQLERPAQQADRIALIFWTNPTIKALDQHCWTQVANSLKYKLERLNQSA